MSQLRTAAGGNPVWSRALLDSFGSDARTTFRPGDHIDPHFAGQENREAVMESNVYQANVYGYNFIRREGKDVATVN